MHLWVTFLKTEVSYLSLCLIYGGVGGKKNLSEMQSGTLRWQYLYEKEVGLGA